MRLSNRDDRNKLIAGGVFALVVAAYLFYTLRDSSPAPVAPVAVTAPAGGTATSVPAVAHVPSGNVAGHAAKSVGTTSAMLDPTLKMGPMLVTEALVYSGSGRNIFSPTSVPVAIAIPKAIAAARPKGPVMPVVQGPVGPPPPPPIDLKFFGTATSANGHRRAFLLHGEDVFLASDGDVVQRRYRVVSIAPNSIVIEDLTNNNRQSLPLLVQ
jgi:hypothetical protein